MFRTYSILPLLVGVLCWTRPSIADDRGLEFFEAKIRPVLVERCNRCHSAGKKEPKGGLRLDSPAGLRKGGDSGVVIVPGKVDESLLVDAIAHEGGVAEMPPDAKLPDHVIADFRRWVEMGAPLPEGEGADSTKLRSTIDLDVGRQFWSFLPVSRKSLPKISEPRWTRNRIDSFVMATLDDHGMRPSPEADRRTLIRRVTFDLTGLPPSPEEVDSFLVDEAPEAFERVVDGLLASPRHGERWGRFWLDVARYAEDNPTGEATNKAPRNPHAYRDWVIRAFNADLPYDEFVRRQLAADLMPDLPRSELAALGFIGLAPVYHKEPKLSAEVISTIVADEWDERVDTTTRGFLGLTVACARCHDHKFDPIGTADYYALAGVMASTQLVERPLVPTSPEVEASLADRRVELVDLELRLGYANEMKSTARKQKEDESKYDGRIAELEARLKTLKAAPLFDGPTAPAVRDAGLWVDGTDSSWTRLDYRPGESRDLPIFLRGNASNHGSIVVRRLPAVLSPSEPRGFGEGSGRKELADGIVGEAASLAGRVIVNRVWGWHFGHPLVTTPSNFGKLGDPPSHPDLLDDLTARFIAGGWSLKALHREIVLSATYRQSSRGVASAVSTDPENKWLGRSHRRRLDIEAWRDAILQVSGSMDPTMGGPSGNLEDSNFRRRTVYGRVSRQRVADVLRVFDFPDANRHGEGRDATTTPLQQLYFLNSPFLLAESDKLAARNLGIQLPAEESEAPRSRVRAAGRRRSSPEDLETPPTRQVVELQLDPKVYVAGLYRKILLREPSADEVERSIRLVEGEGGTDSRDAWAVLAQALLISNEFLFVD
ncbi:Planctomycete cytochrome C [Singulisphaera sp. GP187]|uniref:PSD1 and planctomycete cytochrome C domain-containing protein n=1 Tax=Singulisphaera sp. GP187 TaxID=1882752 RepID=UPI000929A7FD|nr:PSD1 and planctomycete cytochrome C domain-containing protein [Singulisphaera sp. GP187]SIO62408.1 Planctomycete cytochrome C [Singulisphaera sp. GP187]